MSTPPSPRVRTVLGDLLPKILKRRRTAFPVTAPGKCPWQTLFKVIFGREGSFGRCPGHPVRGGRFPCGLPPEHRRLVTSRDTLQTNVNEEELSMQSLTSPPRNCQGHQPQRKPEKPSQLRGAHGDARTCCHVDSGWVPGTENDAK